MPYNTGNSQWDGALTSLSGALFPDPSKVAESYYYGSQARKAQLDSNKDIDEQNWKNRLMQGVYASDGSYSTPAPTSPTWGQPSNVVGAPPIVNSPANLPTMSQVVAPGSRAPTMTPDQAATTITNMAQQIGPSLAQGTPPPASSPTPEAPSAPTTTTTNGQTPQNTDPGSGVFSPHSMNAPDGVQKMAPPAQHNGSPAPIPFNLGTFTATAAAAGYKAPEMDAMGAATLSTLFQRGVIDEHTYHQLLIGAGQSTPATQDTASAAGIKEAQIGAGATIGAENIRAKSAQTIAGMPVQFVVDPNDLTGKTGKWVPTSQLQTAGGTPAMNPQASAEAVKPVQVQPGGPTGPVTSMSTGQAQQTQTPLAQPSVTDIVAGQQGAYGPYLDETGKVIATTAIDAQARKLRPAPTGTDPELAARIAAVNQETDPDKKRALINNLMNLQSAAQPPKQVDAAETAKRGVLLDTRLNSAIPVPAGTHPLQNTYSAGAGPELSPVLDNLTAQYFQRSPDPAIRGNENAAADAALAELKRRGFLDLNQDRSTWGFSNSTTVNRPVMNKDGSIGSTKRFRVDLLDPKTGKPYASGTAPSQVQMLGNPIARAPAGTPNGPQQMNGKSVIVDNGLVYQP